MSTDKTDLESALAEARERSFNWPYGASPLYGFDTAAAVARDVIAKKDTEITQHRATLDRVKLLMANPTHDIGDDELEEPLMVVSVAALKLALESESAFYKVLWQLALPELQEIDKHYRPPSAREIDDL
jgi:hypothetical protein